MPKRKNNKDLDYISDQIKKLKKKLKRARKNNESSSSSDTDSKNSEAGNDLLELGLVSEAETQDVITCPEDISEESTEKPPTSPNEEAASDLPANKDQEGVSNLDKDLLEILGDDPSSTVQYGQEIHKELASRLQHIATSGLTKEVRKDLQQKYLLPSNGVLLGAPTLNPEIKAALTDTLINRDKALEAKQKLLASAISCVASVTSQFLDTPDRNNEILKKLMDANKILCDVQHSNSNTRRMFSTSALKKDVKSQVLSSKIDKLLFGENLPETLKAAKAVSKSGAEIKNTSNINKRHLPSTSKTANLNSKRPAAPARKPPAAAPAKTRQAFSHQNQHARSSKTSSQQPKQTNYRR